MSSNAKVVPPSTTKKVGGAVPPSTKPAATGESKGEKKEKRVSKRVKKTAFDLKNAQMKDKEGKLVSALNEEAELLVGIPEGFSFVTHKPIKKSEFSSTGHFMTHRAALLVHKGETLVNAGKALSAKAESYLKLGDDKSAKSMKKAEKAAAGLAELQAELEASGIDINALLAKAVTERKAKAAQEVTAETK